MLSVICAALLSVAHAQEPPAPPVPPQPPSPAEGPPTAPAYTQDLTPVGIGWDIVPMVGTSAWAHGTEERAISLSLIAGYTGAVDGVELSTAVNIDRLYMDGVQLSGAANLVGGNAAGVQLSGGVNVVGQNAAGVQGAGGVNLVAGGADGLQMAGGVNVVALDMDGVQLAGGVNVVAGSVDGLQAAGGVNVAGGVVDGVQAAGGLNVSGGIDGAQLAPVNYSAGHVDGIQIGVINVARTSDFSLGVINIILEGRTHIDGWVNEGGFAWSAFKHGGEGFHYIYGAGYRPGPEALPAAWGVVLGIGGHTTVGQRFFLDTDLLAQQINEGGAIWSSGISLQNTARAVVGLQLLDHVSLLAGPSYNVLVSDSCGPKYSGPGTVVFDEGPVQVRGWPGWMVGLELL